MATLTELLGEHTGLAGPVAAHLQRLVANWGVLSDMCFADLLLFVPEHGDDEQMVVIGQVRPTTNQTLHLEDLVGRRMSSGERPLVTRAWRLGSVVEDQVDVPARGERARQVCIPVRWGEQVVAILARESALVVGRRPGELERVYVDVFDRLARMISRGEYPFPLDEEDNGEAPRVGDGVMVLDASARVAYASPNAVTALHRLGTYSGVDGARLEELGLEQTAVSNAFANRMPTTVEVSAGSDSTVVIRCIPLTDRQAVTGAIVLLRDVSDLRRRDRLLLSKDAALREVHHRVKNNLQTISSLLRLQSRRLPPGEGRDALQESERRVRSIALVHEILSRDTTDEVDFNDILPSLVRMAEDLGGSHRPIRITHTGETGELPAAVATPLAVVVNELLQNAAEHAFPLDDRAQPEGAPDGETLAAQPPVEVHLDLKRSDDTLVLRVSDNGVGLPAGFSVDRTQSLGLSIVRNLVGTQLGGTISMRSDGGTVVELRVPVDAPTEDDLESL